MEKLIIKVPGAPVREVELAPGVHKVGRSVNTDLQIDHPSVSSSHCEISVNDDAVAVKDLGSTNGTSVDGQLVEECRVLRGQVLRMGEVEVHYLRTTPTQPGIRLAVVPAAGGIVAAAVPLTPHVVRLNTTKPVRRPRNFYKSIPGAFIFPFKRNGWILLASGTVIFGVFDALLNFRVHGFLVVGGMIGGLFGACITGYIFLFLQSIITATALGNDDMPPWPDYDGWWDSAIQPYLRLVGICAACAAPAYFCLIYAGQAGRVLWIPLLVLGFCYAPMALLAVAMDDSLLGLNPMLVVPSILRVPLEYLVSCLLLCLLLAMLGGMILLINFLELPVVSQILAMFFSLYFMIVEMRLLGLLYYTRKDRFGWRA